MLNFNTIGKKHTLAILGTRGIPAKHGGFETFAERLALHLVSKGWEVTVYCQADAGEFRTEYWNGIQLVHIPVHLSTALGTIIFDGKSTWRAARGNGLILTLGYNTAIFSCLYRLKGIINLINMDGIEWQRQKWNRIERYWLRMNELIGCWIGNHLIADHPEIMAHLATRVSPKQITMIPYGADQIISAEPNLLSIYNIDPYKYALVIARPEPENSILEIVSAFSQQKRGFKLIVLGEYKPSKNDYHRKVLEVASDEVLFIGAVYEKLVVNTLRFYARLYVHGHTVGGTNPSLVEALGSSMAVLAHSNSFNRWVAGPSAHYFKDEYECTQELNQLLDDEDELKRMKIASSVRHHEHFLWEKILANYEFLLTRFVR